jgi:hypothetical protein
MEGVPLGILRRVALFYKCGPAYGESVAGRMGVSINEAAKSVAVKRAERPERSRAPRARAVPVAEPRIRGEIRAARSLTSKHKLLESYR